MPRQRVLVKRDDSPRPDGAYVLYWMTAQRRVRWNFALQRAIDWAFELDKPVLVFEALRCDYRWASDRHHRVILEGMLCNRERLAKRHVTYLPFVERSRGEGKGLLEALGDNACCIVTDWYPSFFLPRMLDAAAEKVDCRLEAVDSNGLLPLAAPDKTFHRAVDLRRYLQNHLQPHLLEMPAPDPVARLDGRGLDGPQIPESVREGWTAADLDALLSPGGLDDLPIDHDVTPCDFRGGSEAAEQRLERFLDERLERYVDGRTDLDDRATSELSPDLHYGHLSAHEIFSRVAEREEWTPDRLPSSGRGAREGWWRMSPAAESFLDELVTWRELGYNGSFRREDNEEYGALPDWALETLADHEGDEREHVYSLEQFERAETHDELWNAAQRELLLDGRIHNYLRMVWGKKILEWSATPQDALEVMIELNNKYALDGRDPNSYSGIFWVLGRYDRAWGPEREIFGKVRYMSSENTARKMSVKGYLERYGDSAQSQLELD
ncbi:MAG: deoxyribodipyrimidine photolyase [Acidobacteria bacterium]|nr:MAG: deoxyribodipyrimidine photolyase [Acidobacteriota bacterium]